MAYKKNRYIGAMQYDNSAGYNCGCTDSNGKPKKWYASEIEAKNNAQHSTNNSGQQLEIYRCPKNNGFHLKKKD